MAYKSTSVNYSCNGLSGMLLFTKLPLREFTMANGNGNPVDMDYIDVALVNTPKGLRISLHPVSRGVAISPRQFLLDIHCARSVAKNLADFVTAAEPGQ